jgi:hypothetical protein
VITIYRMLNNHTIPWMTLGSESQFVVYLCCSVVQAGTETQPVFRLCWNYDTYSPNVGEVAFSEFSDPL